MMMMMVVCFCEDQLLKPIFTDNLNKLVVVLLYLSVYIYIRYQTYISISAQYTVTKANANCNQLNNYSELSV